MSGTLTGGQRAAVKNKQRHGTDFYKRIGALGGKKGRTGGFAALTQQQLRKVSAKGGKNGSRLGVKNGQGKIHVQA